MEKILLLKRTFDYTNATNVCDTSSDSAVQSQNAACAFIKDSRYFHQTHNFTSIQSYAIKLYLQMLDIADTAFSYERELIDRLLISVSKGKGSSLQLIAMHILHFLLCGQG